MFSAKILFYGKISFLYNKMMTLANEVWLSRSKETKSSRGVGLETCGRGLDEEEKGCAGCAYAPSVDGTGGTYLCGKLLAAPLCSEGWAAPWREKERFSSTLCFDKSEGRPSTG